MEDGPKLLPQWLRGNSSALHHRGDASDASKRTKPLGTDAARQPLQTDPWLSRTSAGAPGNGLSGLSGPRPQNDFGRVPERGSQTERSWKPRGENGYSLGSHSHRSSYVPATLKAGGRDDHDSISLKPGGGYGTGRSYGRHSVESEGGAAASVGRLDRVQESWPSARTLSTGSTGGVGGGGGGGGAGGRSDEDARSPVRGGLANGGAVGTAAASANASATAKASFDQEFPSLRPSGSPSGLASANTTGSGPSASAPPLTSATVSATASASSALLDTASSSTPYRQTFLSSRTSSNWTSKLAEAPPPAAPQPSVNPKAPTTSLPAAFGSADDNSSAGVQPPPPATTPSPSPSTPPHAGVVAPTAPAVPAVPAPVVPPRPAGVWGTATAMATVAAAAVADGGVGGGGAGVSASSRARLDQLTFRQSKQLIPVISSGGVKSKSNAAGGGMGTTGGMGGGNAGGGGAGGGTTAGRLGGPGGGVPKPLGQPGGMLKMSTSKGGGGDTAVASGTASGGPLVLTSNTMLLSKKASLPLDRPLTLTRTSSASAAPALVACSSAGNLTPCAAAGGADAGARTPARPSATPAAVSQLPKPQSAAACEGVVVVEAHAEVQSLLEPQLSSNAVPKPGQAGSLAAPSGGHPSLQVTEEEEAFLRSLGWTGFEEEGDEADVGLTEEEIAAFRAQQQQQQRQQAAVVPPVAAAAAATSLAASGPAVQLMAVAAAAAVAMPKPVPGRAACGRGKPLIVAASYGSEQISSSTDSDSECE